MVTSARLDGAGLYLSGPGGALVYDDLVATDARGAALPARFALGDGRALIEVDDRGAAYPLRVDPLVQQSGELISSDGTPSGEFGRSVAVSGNTVAVAADNQTVGSVKFEGAVYVFVEPAGGWAELAAQSAELVASWHPPPSARHGLPNPPLRLGSGHVRSHHRGHLHIDVQKWFPHRDSHLPASNRGAAYVFDQPTTAGRGCLPERPVDRLGSCRPDRTIGAGFLGTPWPSRVAPLSLAPSKQLCADPSVARPAARRLRGRCTCSTSRPGAGRGADPERRAGSPLRPR